MPRQNLIGRDSKHLELEGSPGRCLRACRRPDANSVGHETASNAPDVAEVITNAANSGAESAEHAEVIDGAQLGGKPGDSAWVNP